MMKKVLIFLALFGLAHADETNAKVVYDLTTSSLASFEKKILKGIAVNKAHYQRNFRDLDASVMIHGGAYKFFLKDIKNSQYKDDDELVKAFPELKKRIASMSDTYNVSFMICEVGLKNRNIMPKDIVEFVKIVPNAAIGLIDKQNEGFAYLSVSK